MAKSPKDVFNGHISDLIKSLRSTEQELRFRRTESSLPEAIPAPSYPSSGGSGGGVTAGSAAVRVGTAVIGGVAGFMPETSGAVDMQQSLFQASYAAGGHISANDFDRLSRMSQDALGNYQTSVGSAQRSAAILSQFGYDPYSRDGRRMMGQIGAMSMTTGMDNEQVAGIVGSQSTNPVMTNRLRMLGFEMFDSSGNPKDVSSIADHLVKTVWGNSNPNREQIQRGLRPGGAMDLMLQSYIPDPGMQMLVKDAIIKRTMNGGKYAANDAATMEKIGLNNNFLNPRITNMRYLSTESRKTNAFRNSMVTGYNYGTDVASSMNEMFTQLATSAGVLSTAVQTLAGVLGGLEGFGGTGPGGAILGALSAVKPIMPLPFADGGVVAVAEMLAEAGVPRFVTGGQVADEGLRHIGVPYVGNLGHDASPTRGWDCATFAWWVFHHFGKEIPDYTYDMMSDPKAKTVQHGQEQRGDLIMYMSGTWNGKAVHHVAIYTGGGNMVHAANPSSGTKTGRAWDSWGSEHYTKSLRYWDGAASNVGLSPPGGSNDNSGGTTGGSNSSAGTVSSQPSGTTNNAGTEAHKLGASSPSFVGVSLSVGLTGISGKLQSVLSAINGTAPWANLTGAPQRSKPQNSTTTTPDSSTSGTTSVPDTNYTGGGGGTKFAKWLFDKGLRGRTLEEMWVIGMRESGGDPTNEWGGAVGLFQIQDVHFDAIKRKYGWSPEDLKDPDKNFEVTRWLSDNWTNLRPWMVNASTFDLDFTDYGGSREYALKRYSWMSTSIHDFETIKSEYKSAFHQAGIPGYSKGVWRIEDDQIAKIHQNEMVLPSDVAEEVRHEYGHHDTRMTFNIVIGEASNEQAKRFAQRMKTVLDMTSSAVAQ